ncbi:hypothetical protein [Aliikangiella coralliicola]|uniref:Bacterial virulence factor lipase N-terminal domain-containing protein n=1 Tax=Aliikangiella coralliicola TaxID=2592383 RepID=A0A545TWH4_9GAMM|nr:hypothetical protein [Aliikangiella coralliicola]TQV81559.1 hypothetical protein FLL46_25765 [Aliikangiella coralliicola]
MNKLVLGLTIASVLGLSGCDDSPKEPVVPAGTVGSGGAGGVALTKPVFAPSTGSIPLPNDLLFSGTTNLTLNPPVADPANFSDPLVAASSIDGWSATAPFSFSFSNTDNVDINPASVVPGTTVRMYEVSVNRPEALPGTGIPVPTGPVTGVVRELTAGTDFVASYAGPLTVAVLPLRPLTQQASYMVVVTNGVTDANGNPIIADGQYAVAKTEDPIPAGLPTSPLEPVRLLVNAMENAADAAGQPKENIMLSFQFTVQSVGEVISTSKLVYIDAPFAAGAPPRSSFSSLMTDTAPFTTIGAADLYKGEVDLNYYLTAPDSLGNQGHPGVANPLSVLQDFFRGAAQIPDGQGGAVANPFAGDVTTYANRLAAVTGQETAPLLVSMPKTALGCVKPAGGYPVMIFQHGITSDRTSMLGIADTMGAPPTCTAVISMDLPIHGIAADNPVHLGLQQATGGLIGIFEGYAAGGVRERTFGVDYVNNITRLPHQPGEIPDGPDPSGAHTINLTNLLVSRDNGRQAILDLLTLEKAIPAMDVDGDMVPDFDATQVKFMGHSLGGIVGTGFLGHSDLVESAVLANPSGGIALMLDASPTFGPTIRAGLAANGVEAGTPDYNLFLFATQTVIDTMDPASTSAFAVANGVPTLMLQAANDQVIPNFVATAPQSGTTPLAAYMGLTNLTATEAGAVAGERFFSRFNAGGHSSVLSPAENAEITAEMQKQIASFLSSPTGTKAVLVSDPSLLLP